MYIYKVDEEDVVIFGIFHILKYKKSKNTRMFVNVCLSQEHLGGMEPSNSTKPHHTTNLTGISWGEEKGGAASEWKEPPEGWRRGFIRPSDLCGEVPYDRKHCLVINRDKG